MASSGDVNEPGDHDHSYQVMENNEVYGLPSDFSLHSPEPSLLMNTPWERPHEDLHRRFPNPFILDLSNSNLSNDNVFQAREILDQRQPKVLIVDSNGFTNLPELFARPSLEVLSISSQFNRQNSSFDHTPNLKRIPDGISRASDLTDLLAPMNGLSHLPSSFIHLGKLTRIDFKNNHFRVFPPELLSLPALRELNLNSNFISEIPPGIGQLQQLENLEIDNNKLRILPDELCQLKVLSVLSLRANQIVHLPRELYQCSKLIEGELHVSENPLMTYPPSSICNEGTNSIFEYLKREPPPHTTGIQDPLELLPGRLDVRNQHLQKLKLPQNIHDILTIDARNNELSELPQFPEDLKAKILLLDGNEFVSFPLQQLKTFPDLKVLSLKNQVNKNGEYLLQVPSIIYHLRSLKELFLSQNNIAILPDDMFVPHLQVLDLSENKITSLPPAIQSSKELEVLDVSKNGIEILPPEIGQLEKLKVLSVSTNKLTELPDSLCDLSNLQTLSLQSNCLTRLPLYFNKLQKLAIEAEHKITDRTFPNGCMLANNPGLVFPSRNVINQGLQAMFDDLKFWQENPHLYEQVLASQQDSRRGRSVVAANILSDAFLYQLSMCIGDRWHDVGRALNIREPNLGPLENQRDPCVKMLTVWRNTGKRREEAMLGMLAKALDSVQLGTVAAEVRAKTTGEH